MSPCALDKKMMLEILNNLFPGIFITDKRGKVLYVNPAIIRQYGNKPEDLVNVMALFFQ